MFLGAQVNLYCDDVEACAEFYRRLGCAERFRTPTDGVPAMVEVTGPGFTIGLAQAAAGNAHGLEVTPGRTSTELVFWCDDSDGGVRRCARRGRSGGAGADRLARRSAYGWLRDPAGHLLKLVQKL